MTVLIPLAEDEGFQLIILRSSAARILSKRVQVSQRIWVDVVADHARWEYVAYLVKPKLVRRSRGEPHNRVADDHAIGSLARHVRSLSCLAHGWCLVEYASRDELMPPKKDAEPGEAQRPQPLTRGGEISQRDREIVACG